MPRPRVLDVDKAVVLATDLFWQNGYDRTSLADLTHAMGITAPSLYLAFGSKEGLFKRVLEHYRLHHLAYADEALKQTTARAVVEHLLHQRADAVTDPSHPAGCLAVTCGLTQSGKNNPVRREIAALRDAARVRLRRRLQKARAAGDLPADADCEELARFVMTVGWGMAVDAQSGATRKQIHRTVERAMEAWPR